MFKATVRFIQSLLLAAALAAAGTQGVSAASEATFALSFSLGNELFLAPHAATPAQAPLPSADGAVRAAASVKPVRAVPGAGKSAGLGGAGDAGAADPDGDLDGDDDQSGPPVRPVSPVDAGPLAVAARYAPSLPQCVMVPLVPPPRRLPS